LGVSAVQLHCEILRDFFYAGTRYCAFDRQPSFYELLRSSPKASLTELRLAFRLRSLELRAASKSSRDRATLERIFNILGRPELRACYDALLTDPATQALFPYGGFGCLLVAGDLSRDGISLQSLQKKSAKLAKSTIASGSSPLPSTRSARVLKLFQLRRAI
jgi:hypothetical protein